MMQKPAVILTIDDDNLIRESFRLYLEDCGYQVQEAENGRVGLEMIHESVPDLVLLDLRMPEVDGLEVLQEVDDKYPDLPVIVISGTGFVGDAVEAMRQGAWSYLLKPIDDFNALQCAVEQALEKARLIKENRSYREKLEDQVRQRVEALERFNRLLRDSRMEVVLRLGKASELRDKGPAHHVIRVSCYTRILAASMGFSKEEADLMALASALHDVGKIAISDEILLKPGKLSLKEWVEMEKHCLYGRDLLTPFSTEKVKGGIGEGGSILEGIGSDSELLQLSRLVAYSHHEHWDGSGYPEGLKGDEIPLVSRIVTAVDIYDTIGSKRPYREPLAEEKCLQIMREASGSILDPQVVKTFFVSLELLRQVKEQWAD